MLIDLRNLLSGNEDSITVDATIDMETFSTSYGDYPIVDKQTFKLTLDKLDKNKASVKGSSSVTLCIPCDRCLQPVDTVVDFDIDRTLYIGDSINEIEDGEEQDYIDGYNLDVDKLALGEILMGIPGKVLCKPDCKGLCMICGNNLNIKECGCDRESIDPRMSVFKDILKNFKEV